MRGWAKAWLFLLERERGIFMSTAFLFSGQGAQYEGMGKELYEAYPVVRETFDEASDTLGYDVAALCFEPNDRLNLTEYTQPAILTVSTAFLRAANQEWLHPDAVLGLSLGEYTALVASGALPFATAVDLVKKRGRFMTQAAPFGSGKMVAVMNVAVEEIEKSCQEASEMTGKIVVPANYNTPQQIVIGGEVEAVDQAVVLLQEKGVRRMIPLNVSGPFHTPILAPAATQLAQELAQIEFSEMKLPVIANTTAKVMKQDQIKELLERQVMSPVRFYESIATLQDLGVTNYIEVGPGKVLSGFLKKIDKTLVSERIEDQETLKQTLEVFQ